MEFTFVIQCHCGCDTVDTIIVKARDMETAVKQLEREWERGERSVTIVAAFEGNAKVVYSAAAA